MTSLLPVLAAPPSLVGRLPADFIAQVVADGCVPWKEPVIAAREGLAFMPQLFFEDLTPLPVAYSSGRLLPDPLFTLPPSHAEPRSPFWPYGRSRPRGGHSPLGSPPRPWPYHRPPRCPRCSSGWGPTSEPGCSPGWSSNHKIRWAPNRVDH